MLSLRKRAWISGGLAALVSLTVGALLLYSFLNQRELARFDRALTERHTQIVVALSSVPDDTTRLGDLLFDPQYHAPFSGRYWQVTAPDGTIHTSGSLLDATLPAPAPAGATLTIGDGANPVVGEVRIAEQVITLEDGSAWTVLAAESLGQLKSERGDTRRSLVLAFAMVAVIGLASVLVQTAAITRPLDRLRRDVAQRWEQDEELSETDYPEEVAPLVADINGLLHRNREIVSRSRRQAADLAHALKTPSAILRNELTALAEGSQDMTKALDALDRVDAQISRSLARLRTAHSGEATQAKTDLSHSVDRFARLFDMMARREGKRFDVTREPGLTARMDTQDIEEVLGNLLDNALKWCRSTVTLSARKRTGGIEIVIEDDGPGIPEADRAEVMRSGTRLDSSKPGTGLGLAIASDLLQAYGATLVLEDSATLGGLTVRVMLPLRRVRVSK
ncbi:MAG: HAMP domain-containing sensor histidine kinase [Tabrizicola sp.]|uniref:ATP-binding protein n=1 Tax=Tabrizicola sp. TaxID=2005166 RepID=UPI001B4F0D36|nr:HAMP domain-containing histidine kinase [Tabrizicola sp.]